MAVIRPTWIAVDRVWPPAPATSCRGALRRTLKQGPPAMRSASEWSRQRNPSQPARSARSLAPQDVVTRLAEYIGSVGELDAEAPLDQEHHGGSRLRV